MCYVRWFAIVLSLVSSLSCTVNALSSFADKTTDEALYVQAKLQVNAAQYDTALATIAQMQDIRGERRVKVLEASAYAGKCGFTFLGFVEDLAGLSTNLFQFLTTQFVGGTGARIDACVSAEAVIESIGGVADRTTGENIWLALISFAKIGNILSLYTDSDQDGTADPGVNPCQDGRGARPGAPVAGNFFLADLRELAASVNVAIENINAVSGSINLGVGAIGSVSAICTAINGIDPSSNFCGVTNPATFTAQQLDGIQSLLKESTVVGLGSDCTGNVTVCECIPP